MTNSKPNKGVVPFTEISVKEYLDRCIVYWREKRDSSNSINDKETSINYIDAFQSVRCSLFGEQLKENKIRNHLIKA